MSANPYSPPKAALEAHAHGEYWRDGKNVMCRPGSTLPPRCVKCNEPALQGMKARKLYWHHSAWYLFVFVNIVIYVIVAMIVRRKAVVTYGICAKHRNRRWLFIAIGWGGKALFPSGFATNPHNRRWLFIAIGWGGVAVGVLLILANAAVALILMLVAMLTGLFGSRLAYPTRITKEEVRLGGCGEAFLDSIELGAEAAVPAPRLGLGSCPNCHARLPMDAPACLKCKAVLSPGSVLTPIRG